MSHFSNSRKDRIATLYEVPLKEFVRAYLFYNGKKRTKDLMEYCLSIEIPKGDIDLMIAIAQDFVATNEMMGFQQKQVLTVDIPHLPSDAKSPFDTGKGGVKGDFSER